jgi:glycosyltransferase involved in cell wall biosynthesis
MKIAFCAIVKPDKREAKLLNNCLDSIYSWVDTIYITITGKEGQCPEIEKVCKKYNAKISYFKWVNDFAQARNFNFSQAKEDWILWADSDDEIKGGEYLGSVINLLNREGADIGVLDYEYDHDKWGNVTVQHKKARIIKNDGCVKWVGKLHEDLMPQREVKSYFIENIKIIHKSTPERKEEAKERNLKIALLQYQENPADPKNIWDVANALLSLGKLKEAIRFYLEFIPKSGSEEEKYLAWIRTAGAMRDLGDFERAIESEWEALKIRPEYPDAHLGLGEIYYRMGKPQYAKEWLIQGLTKEIPEYTAIVWNPRDYDYNPLMILSRVYFELNRPKDAKACIQKCLQLYPKNPDLKRTLKILDREIEKLEKIDKICEKIKVAKTKEEIKMLIDTAPIELRSHPKLVYLKNIHFIKENSSGRDLVIYCYQTDEEFDPDLILKEGRGGSEEAVYHMSKRLANLGWNVVVYANCGWKEKQFGKVFWKPWWSFNPRDRQDVLIVWRHPAIYEIPKINAKKKYVWLHDILRPQEFTERRLNHIDKIIALSKWQRDLFPDIPNNKFLISGNGIDLEMIKKAESKRIKRNPYRLIYTSSYDRGLETLLKLFPQIRHEVPQAELHIFYGWNLWDRMHAGNKKMEEKKQRILRLLQQPGVYEHGRVPQEQILDEYLKSSILAYPTEFGEISFITGMKAQALGCIPITTTAGCLDETIQFGLKVDSKDIYTDTNAQKEWVEGVLNVLENPPTEKEREEMKQWAKKKFNWDNISQQWNKEFLSSN